jgi:hypothetical protein
MAVWRQAIVVTPDIIQIKNNCLDCSCTDAALALGLREHRHRTRQMLMTALPPALNQRKSRLPIMRRRTNLKVC